MTKRLKKVIAVPSAIQSLFVFWRALNAKGIKGAQRSEAVANFPEQLRVNLLPKKAGLTYSQRRTLLFDFIREYVDSLPAPTTKG